MIDWLLADGFTVEQIRVVVLADAAAGAAGARRRRHYVSARQISEQIGLDLEQLIRFQRAAGLPHVDDPDAPAFMRPDGDSAVHIKRFLDLGIDPDLMLVVVRVLAQGLANAAEVMRAAALARGAAPRGQRTRDRPGVPRPW